jgi:outer membrane protein assembly factor BamB
VATAGDVYVGSGKHVVCLDASNGSLCWHPPFTADSRVVTTPVVGNGVDTIYVGTLDGNVYALTPGGRVLRAR